MVLILSGDALGAALVGALVETLGYVVRYAPSYLPPQESLRQARPRVAMIDSLHAPVVSEEFLGHAAMRGISIIVYGTSEALDQVRAIVDAHSLGTLLVPIEPDVLRRLLERASERDG